MTDLSEFVVPARRVLGPIRAARAEMAAGQLWRATVSSARYGVYTIAGAVRAVGADLHIGGFNLGSETSPPSDLHDLSRIDAVEGAAASDTGIAHGDLVRVFLTYRPDEVILVSGPALVREGYGHLLVGGWHVVHPAVRSVSVVARAGEHGLAVPSPLPAMKTD